MAELTDKLEREIRKYTERNLHLRDGKWNSALLAALDQAREEANQERLSLKSLRNQVENPTFAGCWYGEDAHAVSEHIERLMKENHAQAERDMDGLQRRVVEWAKVTFPNATEESTLAHAKDEMERELNHYANIDEYADVVLLLMHAIGRFRHCSLHKVCEAKFATNQQRKWGPVNERGFREHIRSQPAPEPPCERCGGEGTVHRREREPGELQEYDPCPGCRP